MKWISVKDRLPESVNPPVLTFGGDGWVIGGYDDDNCCWFSDWDTIIKKVTHWMPLPQPRAKKMSELEKARAALKKIRDMTQSAENYYRDHGTYPNSFFEDLLESIILEVENVLSTQSEEPTTN